jgi:hypothetical protein
VSATAAEPRGNGHGELTPYQQMDRRVEEVEVKVDNAETNLNTHASDIRALQDGQRDLAESLGKVMTSASTVAANSRRSADAAEAASKSSRESENAALEALAGVQGFLETDRREHEKLSGRVASIESGPERPQMPSLHFAKDVFSENTRNDIRAAVMEGDMSPILGKFEEERLARVRAETALQERERHSDRVEQRKEAAWARWLKLGGLIVGGGGAGAAILKLIQTLFQ